MSSPLLSVLAATYNRAPLLDRALACYARQTMPRDRWEYVLADDGSADDTRAVAEKWKRAGVPIRYFDAATDLRLPKQPGQWRDGCVVRNAASTHCVGSILLATHPEIMPPPDALERMAATVQAHPGAWVTAVPYWLPKYDYDLLPWRGDLHALRQTPGFYSPDWQPQPGTIDYANNNQERRDSWESEVFWAMRMALWREIGGFREFPVWGPVDPDFMDRRRCLGIKTVIARSPDSPAPSGNLMVYHQWHPSPRDMDVCHEKLRERKPYLRPEDARAVGGLAANRTHGPREVPADAGTAGVMADHVSRYKFAAQFVGPGDRVLDLCCGSGYGSTLLPGGAFYTGVEADRATVEAAARLARHGRAFVAADAAATGLPGETFDRVLCFEGLEHCEDQPGVVAEMHRLLKPGGTFIVSTPQKGVAHGTPWDRFMLTRMELVSLFGPDRWANLDWFHQMRYGSGPDGNPVRPGVPPADAEIMILGGTKR